jgi:hypothetical protein
MWSHDFNYGNLANLSVAVLFDHVIYNYKTPFCAKDAKSIETYGGQNQATPLS